MWLVASVPASRTFEGQTGCNYALITLAPPAPPPPQPSFPLSSCVCLFWGAESACLVTSCVLTDLERCVKRSTTAQSNASVKTTESACHRALQVFAFFCPVTHVSLDEHTSHMRMLKTRHFSFYFAVALTDINQQTMAQQGVQRPVGARAPAVSPQPGGFASGAPCYRQGTHQGRARPECNQEQWAVLFQEAWRCNAQVSTSTVMGASACRKQHLLCTIYDSWSWGGMSHCS